eukprot:gene9139-1227_t
MKHANDKEIVMECIKINESEYKNISIELKNDSNIVDLLLSISVVSFNLLPKTFQQDENLILKQLDKNPSFGMIYNQLSEKTKLNYEISKRMIELYPKNYQYIPNQLKDNFEIIKVAEEYFVSQFHSDDTCYSYSQYWHRIPRYFAQNENFLKKIFRLHKFNNSYFEYFPKDLRSNEKLLNLFLNYEVISKRGKSALYYAPKEFQKRKDLILMSFNQSLHVKNYLNNEKFEDMDIALKAISVQPSTIIHVPKLMFQDKWFFSEMAKLKNVVCKQYSKKHTAFSRSDLEIIFQDSLKNINFNEKELIEIIKENGNVLHFLNLKEYSKEFLFEAVKYCKDVFKMDFDFDRDLILHSMNCHGNNLKFASNELQDDEEVVYSAMMNSNVSLKFMSLRLRNEKRFVLKIIHGRKMEIKNCPTLKCDMEIVWRSKYHKLIRDIDLKNIHFSFEF